MSDIRIRLGTPNRRWAWTIRGEAYRPNSAAEYVPEEASGVVAAEGAGEALVLITTGLGPGDFEEKLANTIPWDLITGDRPVTITVAPVAEEAMSAEAASAVRDTQDGGQQ